MKNWITRNRKWVLVAAVTTALIAVADWAQDAKVWRLTEEQVKEGEKFEGQVIALQQSLDQTISAGLQANVDAQSALIAQSQLKIVFLNRELAKMQKQYWELKTVADALCKECAEMAVDLKAKQLRRQPKPKAARWE